MEQYQDVVLDALRNAGVFLDANPLVNLEVASARAVLDRTAAELAAHAEVQVASHRASVAATVGQNRLKVRIIEMHMRPIAATAALSLPNVPDGDAFVAANRRTMKPELVTKAATMADAARQHEQVFVDAGHSPTFIADLLADAEALRASLCARRLWRASRTGATAQLEATARRGKSVLRVLDGRVTPLLGDDAKRLATWKAAIAARKPRARRSAAGR